MSEVPPRVAMVTLGCKVNQADTEELARALERAGTSFVEAQDADVIIVNTCCVTTEAERKVRKAIRRALAENPMAQVLVTGCLATIDPLGIAALDARVRVESDRDALAEHVGALVGGEPAAVDVAAVGTGERGPGGPFRSRATLKVQDGCDCACAYCIVPAARGASRSLGVAEALSGLERLQGEGAGEIVVTGVNLGLWRSGDLRLADLIARLSAAAKARLRLSSIEPPFVSGDLARAVAGSACPHLHVPLQSGSDRVLSAMLRGYTSREYVAAVEGALELIPGLTVTTDVIAGFPGESAQDHEATVALLRRLEGVVSKVHVFRFSPRPGTVAAQMGDAVPHAVVAERAAELRAAGDELREAYVHGRLGASAEVLIERCVDDRFEGTSEDYVRVVTDRPDAEIGSLLRVTLGSWDGSRVTAA